MKYIAPIKVCSVSWTYDLIHDLWLLHRGMVYKEISARLSYHSLFPSFYIVDEKKMITKYIIVSNPHAASMNSRKLIDHS